MWEGIVVCAAGDGWVAVGTSGQMIRVFTAGGVQLAIVSVAGPIVAMSGHEKKLMCIYHSGIGKLVH